jgi:hypothetical protein
MTHFCCTRLAKHNTHSPLYYHLTPAKKQRTCRVNTSTHDCPNDAFLLQPGHTNTIHTHTHTLTTKLTSHPAKKQRTSRVNTSTNKIITNTNRRKRTQRNISKNNIIAVKYSARNTLFSYLLKADVGNENHSTIPLFLKCIRAMEMWVMKIIVLYMIKTSYYPNSYMFIQIITISMSSIFVHSTMSSLENALFYFFQSCQNIYPNIKNKILQRH